MAEGIVSYAEFAEEWARRPDWRSDSTFSVRLLRECVLQAQHLPPGKALDSFHREPPLTGCRGWDALLAGTAVFTGAGRVSPGVLDWARGAGRRCQELFDPIGIPERYRILDMLRTPAAIRERNVVLAIGNLQGV